MRPVDEVLYAYGLLDGGWLWQVRLAPAGAKGRNPAFDVTPADYVHRIITQKGIFNSGEIIQALGRQ